MLQAAGGLKHVGPAAGWGRCERLGGTGRVRAPLGTGIRSEIRGKGDRDRNLGPSRGVQGNSCLSREVSARRCGGDCALPAAPARRAARPRPRRPARASTPAEVRGWGGVDGRRDTTSCVPVPLPRPRSRFPSTRNSLPHTSHRGPRSFTIARRTPSPLMSLTGFRSNELRQMRRLQPNEQPSRHLSEKKQSQHRHERNGRDLLHLFHGPHRLA
jgi:hypothetical protein